MNRKSHSLKHLLAGLCLTVVAPQPLYAIDTFFVGGGVGTTEFDEDVFEGDGDSLVLEIGFRFNTGNESHERSPLEIGLMYDGLFSINASRGDDDDLDLSTMTIYLRRDQQLGDKVWGFGQIGYSSLEVDDSSTSCGFLFNCTTSTNYRNEDKGITWGVGLNFRTGREYLLSIGYFDYSLSDIDASTWKITLRRETN